MPFIIGTPIPEDIILVESVSQIYGISLSQSKLLCRKAGFGQDCRGKNLSFSQDKILGNVAEISCAPPGVEDATLALQRPCWPELHWCTFQVPPEFIYIVPTLVKLVGRYRPWQKSCPRSSLSICCRDARCVLAILRVRIYIYLCGKTCLPSFMIHAC